MTKAVPADPLADDAFLRKRRPDALLQNAVRTERFLSVVPNGGEQKIEVACVGRSLSPFQKRAEHNRMERHGTAGRFGFRLSDSISSLPRHGFPNSLPEFASLLGCPQGLQHTDINRGHLSAWGTAVGVNRDDFRERTLHRSSCSLIRCARSNSQRAQVFPNCMIQRIN